MDQYREGADIVIARSGSEICPVSRLEKYYRIAGLNLLSRELLFRAITHTKNGDKLRSSGSRIRELIHCKVKSLGYDPKLFGTHSFRAGGQPRGT